MIGYARIVGGVCLLLECNDSGTAMHYLNGFFKRANFPKNKIMFLHARLKPLKECTGLDYKELTKHIIEILEKLYKPKTILIPSFTYSFTKSGVYHKYFSKSEVGRFSEEARKIVPYRTPDPIFNVLDTNDYLPTLGSKLDYSTAFGKNSLFDYLHDEDCLIVNLGIDKLISTQLHYIESQNQVSYRYDKLFYGVIYHTETRWENIDYQYYVRDLKKNPQWDREKIKDYLLENNALYRLENNNIELNWITAQTKSKFISQALKNDESFLLKKGGS
jgi:aminoglycoside N3'-acetyltransferase